MFKKEFLLKRMIFNSSLIYHQFMFKYYTKLMNNYQKIIKKLF